MANPNGLTNEDAWELWDQASAKLQQARALVYMLGTLGDVDIPDGTHCWSTEAVANLIDEVKEMMNRLYRGRAHGAVSNG